VAFWQISADDDSAVGPSEINTPISANWNSPFAVGSGANATATQTTADPETLRAVAPSTGSNTTILYLGLGLIGLAGVFIVTMNRKRR
jgi:LPXTG-motif cell wall-anchored protein